VRERRSAARIQVRSPRATSWELCALPSRIRLHAIAVGTAVRNPHGTASQRPVALLQRVPRARPRHRAMAGAHSATARFDLARAATALGRAPSWSATHCQRCGPKRADLRDAFDRSKAAQLCTSQEMTRNNIGHNLHPAACNMQRAKRNVQQHIVRRAARCRLGAAATHAWICAGTGLAPATSAPGLGSPLPHLSRYMRAVPLIYLLCTGTGLAPATSAP
jgi:hypothetical protein